jgi:hypothetical protein
MGLLMNLILYFLLSNELALVKKRLLDKVSQVDGDAHKVVIAATDPDHCCIDVTGSSDTING